jgi:putative ABC transport system permease protein
MSALAAGGMTQVALKGLAGRKVRAGLTAAAIVLGVAMVSGTFILTDTINRAFNSIITQSYQNTDAVITGKVAFTNSDSGTLAPPSFPQDVLAKVRALPDVDAAAGAVLDQAKLIGRDGKVISSTGSATAAFSVDSHDSRFDPLRLETGNWPVGSTEVAIDRKTANAKGFRVGDTIGVATEGPVRQFTVAGIVSFSGADLGGTTIAAFDLPTSQQLFDKENRLDIVRVAGKTGVSEAKLAAEIRPLLPPTARVRTAEQQQASDSSGLGFVDFIKYFLLAFAGIALFVGCFVIANTLSITIAQRVRELATLRTIGATRRQVRRSVLVEALVIGLVGSIVGLALGFGLAKLLDALIRTIGIDLPQAGLVFTTRTVVVSLLVGVGITLLASLRPAMRATRVPPIAAVREGSVLPSSRLARFGPITAVLVLVLAILLLLYGVFAHGVATAPRLLSLGLGVLLLFLGASLNAPRLVRPLAKVLGWPGAKLGGPAGGLAQRNATRNPSRTASTAAALMIGLALVTFVAILGQGLRASFDDAVNKLFVADYALTAPDNFAPFSVSADEAVGGTPGVTAVTPIRQGDARVFGKTALVTAVPPNLQRTVAAEWYRGGPDVAAKLGRDGAFVEKKYAEKHHLSLGSPIALTTPTGKVLHLRLKGIFKAPKGGSPFGDVNFSLETFDANYAKPQNLMTLIDINGGVSDANTARLKLATTSYPEVKVQTRDQFKKGQAAFINKLLNLLYALLGLSVIVSLFGIVNTLVLTVFERTRELGMLRAVGMTRRQVRQMIRHESIVTALIGATLGLVLGVFLAVLVTQALSSQGIVFAVPWNSVGLFVLAALLVGILAAVVPARHASRLNVLKALQYE